MSIPDNGTTTGRGGVKTLAIRLDPQLHAQLGLVAQLRGSTITDEIRTAIETHIAVAVANPDFAERAGNVLADIEREAEARRVAITNLLAPDGGDRRPGAGKARRPADQPRTDKARGTQPGG